VRDRPALVQLIVIAGGREACGLRVELCVAEPFPRKARSRQRLFQPCLDQACRRKASTSRVLSQRPARATISPLREAQPKPQIPIPGHRRSCSELPCRTRTRRLHRACAQANLAAVENDKRLRSFHTLLYKRD